MTGINDALVHEATGGHATNMTAPDIETFIAHWRETGGSELANTQSFINALCRLIGVEPPHGSRADDAHNDYVFERRVFQDNGDGSVSFGRTDAYKRNAFILEAKQGSDADRAAAEVATMIWTCSDRRPPRA